MGVTKVPPLFYMTQKPRILVCSESTKVTSGFGIYNKNLIEGLYKTQKYEIAEFAAYGLIGDKEQYNIPWKYYPNGINPNDHRNNEYKSKAENQFGRWRFDRVVLDFKPHIVIDIRDYWMSYFEKSSPFRKYFHWILMPTIDSEPQKDEWLDTYMDADAIFTYSDWGAKILNKQTNNGINYIGTSSPAANEKAFMPTKNIMGKKQLKKSLVIDPDWFVIGTIMRNQKRKLFPELIKAFEKLIQRLREENNSKAEKVRLYLHTSFPDAGWDIAELIDSSSESNKILISYCCQKCGCLFASNFAGFSQLCYSCGINQAVIPSIAKSIQDTALGKIVSSFDAYIQYAICEGFGMPQIEAAFCGVPVVTVNYSAMEDVIEKIGATSIQVATKFKELETGANRVYPDIDDTVNKLYELVNTPDNVLCRIGQEQHDKAKKLYSWDRVVQQWSNYLDTVDWSYYEDLWENSSNFEDIPEIKESNIDANLTVYQNLVRLQPLLEQVNLSISDYTLLRLIYFAENGYIVEGPSVKNYKISHLIDYINNIIKNYNHSHIALKYPNLLTEEDYIEYANSEKTK